MTDDRDDQSGRIGDPRALRALAHPLRWKLIDLLTAHGQLTATQCSAESGESVASCSYHLNMLAKYGFIEQAPSGPGRDKPWRMLSTRQQLSGAGMGEEGELAAEAATEAFLDHELAKLKARLRAAGREPEHWHSATAVSGTTTWLTVEELGEVTEQLRQIAARYADRASNRAVRPAQGREVRIFFATTVAPQSKGVTE